MENSNNGSQLKRPKYSQSEINMFLKCGKQWEFRYIKNLVLPPSGAMSLGSSVDAGISTNLVHRIEKESDMPLSDVLDVYSTDFDVRKSEADWKDEDPGEQKDVGAKLIETHYKEINPSLKPATVQEKFILELDGGYDLTGTLDLTETNDVVSDLKTSGKKYDEDLTATIQSSLYAFAFEALRKRKAKEFRYDVLIKTKIPKSQQLVLKVTDDHLSHFFGAVENMHKAIQHGIALPAAEGSWWCSKNWCGYWSMCKGKKS